MSEPEKLTREQAAIVSAYTGYLIGSFGDMALYAQRIMGRPIWTHQYIDLADEIRERAKADFIAMSPAAAIRESA